MPPSIIIDAKAKAKKLENFDYSKRSQGPSSEQGLTEQPGAAIDFLHTFLRLPVDNMNEKEMLNVVLPLLKQHGFK